MTLAIGDRVKLRSGEWGVIDHVDPRDGWTLIGVQHDSGGHTTTGSDAIADQCGVVGRGIHAPVCCLAPGHAGPHMERVAVMREIKEQP